MLPSVLSRTSSRAITVSKECVGPRVAASAILGRGGNDCGVIYEDRTSVAAAGQGQFVLIEAPRQHELKWCRDRVDMMDSYAMLMACSRIAMFSASNRDISSSTLCIHIRRDCVELVRAISLMLLGRQRNRWLNCGRRRCRNLRQGRTWTK
jgi:hypothetical protein